MAWQTRAMVGQDRVRFFDRMVRAAFSRIVRYSSAVSLLGMMAVEIFCHVGQLEARLVVCQVSWTFVSGDECADPFAGDGDASVVIHFAFSQVKVSQNGSPCCSSSSAHRSPLSQVDA
jgi:hypothetical protein